MSILRSLARTLLRATGFAHHDRWLCPVCTHVNDSEEHPGVAAGLCSGEACGARRVLAMASGETPRAEITAAEYRGLEA